jgi:hypothetical protein
MLAWPYAAELKSDAGRSVLPELGILPFKQTLRLEWASPSYS